MGMIKTKQRNEVSILNGRIYSLILNANKVVFSDGCLSYGSLGGSEFRVCALWRGVGSSRLGRIRNYLLRVVQPQMRILPELGHQVSNTSVIWR
jgi:hypothetical protein